MTRSRRTGDTKKQDELMKQVLQDRPRSSSRPSASALPTNGYGLVKNNFKNVPKIMPLAPGSIRTQARSSPEQYYFDKEGGGAAGQTPTCQVPEI